MNTTKWSKSIFRVVALISALAFASAHAVNLPFDDGFENITVGDYPDENGWQNLFSGKSAYVSADVAHTGTKSFRQDSYRNWARMDYVHLDEVPDRLTYQVSVYVDPTHGQVALVGFMKGVANMGPTWNRFAIDARNGKVSFGGQAHVEVGTYTSGTWCTVRADLDYVNLKGNLWLDGQLAAEGVDIRPKEFDFGGYGHVVSDKWGLVSHNYASGSSNVIYFDDVKIYPTPPTIEDYAVSSYGWWYLDEVLTDGTLIPNGGFEEVPEEDLACWYSWYGGSCHYGCYGQCRDICCRWLGGWEVCTCAGGVYKNEDEAPEGSQYVSGCSFPSTVSFFASPAFTIEDETSFVARFGGCGKISVEIKPEGASWMELIRFRDLGSPVGSEAYCSSAHCDRCGAECNDEGALGRIDWTTFLIDTSTWKGHQGQIRFKWTRCPSWCCGSGLSVDNVRTHRLQVPGQITGVVTDRQTGEPIECATVVMMDVYGYFIKDTPTDAAGSYVLSELGGLAEGLFPCYLKVLAEDHGQESGRVEYSELQSGFVADFELTPGRILNVPYYNQGYTPWCGPTSLSMALKNGNIDFKPWEIAAEYSLAVTPRYLEGPFPVKDFCRRKGIVCEDRYWGVPPQNEPIAEMLEYVKGEVSRGRAVVLTMPSPTKHAVAIVGYDEDDNLYINDPSEDLFKEQLGYLDDWSKLVFAGRVPWYELEPILQRNVGLLSCNATYVPYVDASMSSGLSCYVFNNVAGQRVQMPFLGDTFPNQHCSQLQFTNGSGANRLELRLDGTSTLGYSYYNASGDHPELLHSSFRYAALPHDSLSFSPYISNALPYGLDDPNLHLWIGKIFPSGEELTGEDGNDFGYRTARLHPFCSLYDDQVHLLHEPSAGVGKFGAPFQLVSLDPGYDYCLHLEIHRSTSDPEPADELSFKFHLLDEVNVPPQGGTVAVPDGDSNPSNNTRIEIPEAAVQEETVITVTKVDAAPNADYAVIDPRLARPITAYEIAGRDEQGKEVPVIFESMATIYLWYPDIDNDGYVDGISPPLHESSLHVWTWHEGQHRWQLVTNAWIDTENNLMGLHTYHLSTFAVFANMPPIANAGADQTVECACNTEQGTKVTLDGTDSNDPDADPLTYTWTGPFVESPVLGPTPTVTLMDGCPGQYVITLVVNDGELDSEPNEVVITVVDTTSPSIVCPADVTCEYPADTSPAATGSATATDTCAEGTVTYSDTSVPGCANTETITRTWTATDEAGNSSSCIQTITVVDTTAPQVEIAVPAGGAALQDGVTLAADACDLSGVVQVYFYLREPNDGNGVPVGYEGLAAIFNPGTGKWELPFDTTVLPDGYYVLLAKAVDACGNVGWSEFVAFSIRNWAVLELLPASEDNKAGRTMPVKFSLRIAEAVDPAMPFVYNEGLEIRILNSTEPGNILQTSLFGDSATDYRIDSVGELYITNFKTERDPAGYVVEIWRTSKNFMVGSFAFETMK